MAKVEVSFGEWLKRRRNAAGLTQEQLALKISYSTSALKKIEAEERRPSAQIVERLVELFDIPQGERKSFLRFARGDWQAFAGVEFEEAPWHVSLTAARSNLPVSLTSFVGREREEGELIDLVKKNRLVTLTGAGGIGKTRLSIQAASTLLNDFPNGSWLVELASILDPTLVPRATAIAVGLRDEPQRPVINMLCDYLRDKYMLLLLDNCEHLVDACARMADKILHAAPNVRILATSREALGIEGEVIYYVPSLGLPNIQHPPPVESLRQYEAVQLFIDRATSALSTFTMTHENAPSLAQICCRLDGIPLAIELAAAKVRVLSVKQISKRLDDLFHLLTSGSRTALERHQTLRAAIDWSYNLLSPAEQTLFRRLSVFVGGWTLEAAESICLDASVLGVVQSEGVLDLLEQLINKSLVGKEDIRTETRYHMLETMRQYAEEKLVESGECDALRDHHLDYFLSLAEIAEPHLARYEQLEWLERLESEHENLRSALEYAMSKELPEYALRLCIALAKFWKLHSYWTEGAKWLERALAKQARNLTKAERTIRVRALCWDAELASELDNLERMQRSADASLALCEKGINACDFAIAKYEAGYSFFRHSDYVQARPLLEESLVIFRDLQNLYWEANAQSLLSLTLIAIAEKGYGRWIEQDLELMRKSGERLVIAEFLYYRAYRSWLYNQFDEAEAYLLKEADFLYDEIGYKVPTRATLLQGWIAQIRNDHQQAKAIYNRLINECELIGKNWPKAYAIQYLAMIAREEGNLKQALTYIQESFQISKEFGFKTVGDVRQALLAQLEYLLGDIENSKRNFKESLSTAKVLNNLHSKTNTLFVFANTFMSRNARFSVQIIGALDSYFKNKLKEPIDPLLRRETDANMAQARRYLNEFTFDTVWMEGEKLSLDEALDFALKIIDEM